MKCDRLQKLIATTVFASIVILAIPSSVLSQTPQDQETVTLDNEKFEGSYYCSTRIGGGASYTASTNTWDPATYSQKEGFIFKLRHIVQMQSGSMFALQSTPIFRYGVYEISIRYEGTQLVDRCSNRSDGNYNLRSEGRLVCGIMSSRSEINLNNMRFAITNLEQYLGDSSQNSNGNSRTAPSAHVLIGTCTKID